MTDEQPTPQQVIGELAAAMMDLVDEYGIESVQVGGVALLVSTTDGGHALALRSTHTLGPGRLNLWREALKSDTDDTLRAMHLELVARRLRIEELEGGGA